MPIYEFICRNCGEEFELLVRGESDRREAACTQCNSKDIEKQFSAFGMSGIESRGSGSSCSSCSSKNCSSCGG